VDRWTEWFFGLTIVLLPKCNFIASPMIRIRFGFGFCPLVHFLEGLIHLRIVGNDDGMMMMIKIFVLFFTVIL